MASSFSDSLDKLAGDSTRSFDDDGYFGYDPRLASQQVDSFSTFSDSESVKQSALDDSSIALFPAVHVSGGGFPSDPADFSSFSPEDGEGGFGGPILPPPAAMEPEDGVALREWRRANLTRLAEKEKREKESLSHIIDEAEEYKVEFYKKRTVSCEANKGSNREREKIFLVSHEKFHAEADKTYWKAIAELIPKEVPDIEKKRGKKEQDKNTTPSVAVMRGPKPGKPTDLSRMRHLLLKLKHNTPPHLEHTPPPAADSKTGAAAASAPPPPTTKNAASVATSVEAVAVA